MCVCDCTSVRAYVCVCSFECSCVNLLSIYFCFSLPFFLRFHVFSLPLYWCRLACPLTQVCSLSHIWCGCSRATAGGRIDAGPDSTARIAAFHAGVGWPGAACLSSCAWRGEAIRECRGSAWQDQPAVLPQNCCRYGKIGSKFSTCPTLLLVCIWFRGLKFKGKARVWPLENKQKYTALLKYAVVWFCEFYSLIQGLSCMHVHMVHGLCRQWNVRLQRTWNKHNLLMCYWDTKLSFIMIFFLTWCIFVVVALLVYASLKCCWLYWPCAFGTMITC